MQAGRVNETWEYDADDPFHKWNSKPADDEDPTHGHSQQEHSKCTFDGENLDQKGSQPASGSKGPDAETDAASFIKMKALHQKVIYKKPDAKCIDMINHDELPKKADPTMHNSHLYLYSEDFHKVKDQKGKDFVEMQSKPMGARAFELAFVLFFL